MPFKSLFKCCTDNLKGTWNIGNDSLNTSQHNLVSQIPGIDGFDPNTENVYDNHTSMFRTVANDDMPDFANLDHLTSSPRRTVQNEYCRPKLGTKKEASEPDDTRRLKSSKRGSLKRLLFRESAIEWSPNDKVQSEVIHHFGRGEVAGLDDSYVGDDACTKDDCSVYQCVELKSCCKLSCKYAVNMVRERPQASGINQDIESEIPSEPNEGTCKKKKKKRCSSQGKKKSLKFSLKKTKSDSGLPTSTPDCSFRYFQDEHDNNYDEVDQYKENDLEYDSEGHNCDDHIYEDVVVHFVRIKDSKPHLNTDLPVGIIAKGDQSNSNSEQSHYATYNSYETHTEDIDLLAEASGVNDKDNGHLNQNTVLVENELQDCLDEEENKVDPAEKMVQNNSLADTAPFDSMNKDKNTFKRKIDFDDIVNVACIESELVDDLNNRDETTAQNNIHSLKETNSDKTTSQSNIGSLNGINLSSNETSSQSNIDSLKETCSNEITSQNNNDTQEDTNLSSNEITSQNNIDIHKDKNSGSNETTSQNKIDSLKETCLNEIASQNNIDALKEIYLSLNETTSQSYIESPKFNETYSSSNEAASQNNIDSLKETCPNEITSQNNIDALKETYPSSDEISGSNIESLKDTNSNENVEEREISNDTSIKSGYTTNLSVLNKKPDKSMIPKRSASMYVPRQRSTTSAFWRRNIRKRTKSLIEIDIDFSDIEEEAETFMSDTEVENEVFKVDTEKGIHKTDLEQEMFKSDTEKDTCYSGIDEETFKSTTEKETLKQTITIETYKSDSGTESLNIDIEKEELTLEKETVKTDEEEGRQKSYRNKMPLSKDNNVDSVKANIDSVCLSNIESADGINNGNDNNQQSTNENNLDLHISLESNKYAVSNGRHIPVMLNKKPDKSLIPKRSASMYTPRRRSIASANWRRISSKRSISLYDNALDIDIDFNEIDIQKEILKSDIDIENAKSVIDKETALLDTRKQTVKLDTEKEGFDSNIQKESDTEDEMFELDRNNQTKLENDILSKNNIVDTESFDPVNDQENAADICLDITDDDTESDVAVNLDEVDMEVDLDEHCGLESMYSEVIQENEFDDFIDEFDRKLSWLYRTQGTADTRIRLRRNKSLSPHPDRPKSEIGVRWADGDSGDYDITETTVKLRNKSARDRPRPKSDLDGSSFLSERMKAFGSEINLQPYCSLRSLYEMKRNDLDRQKNRRMSTPHPIKSRLQRAPQKLHKQQPLVRSSSMPESLEKIHKRRKMHHLLDFHLDTLSRHIDIDTLSDESDLSFDQASLQERSISVQSSSSQLTAMDEDEDNLTYAEALWDHITMDPEELGFRAQDVIEVLDMADKDWWFGVIDDREGWFPATFVRIRVNQDELDDDLDLDTTIQDNLTTSPKLRRISMFNKNQARSNVVNEIINAEKEYVKHLKDVVEGYIQHARKRTEMFPEERIALIFGNLEKIYSFAQKFVSQLEMCIDVCPHLSEIGQCFLDNERGFEIYSDYCNNHPSACEELDELCKDSKYKHFFEACRLLQELVEIPLEGFLLTPVQKICKYPLQLAELLKYTPPDHADYQMVKDALAAMRKIATLINERKRKMESIEKIAVWQHSVVDWEGPDLLEGSSELIFSGELNKINTAGWSQERFFFLFDHQVVYCKKELLKRHVFSYKGRIDLDHCDIIDIPDGKDSQYNVTVKHAWKFHETLKDKWYLIYAKSEAVKQSWLKAIRDERQRVLQDQENDFCVPDHWKQTVLNKVRSQSHLKDKQSGGRMSHGQLLMQKDLKDFTYSTLPRHRTSQKHDKKKGWFKFGGGKKSKR
ncbi:uncharacterized protein LOC132756174 isoform X2 [Ruditapes philippinarum]|uniref:uncharacterized protein LOC132756174 isoform X2 n=1 Tax=Ruditapes philippinarum TaxID=129788 RepID=UPI00295B7EBD|nr:uncharacterized protein LOC132756174 isoform X2 [Ruditapes philippinarum]